jgi:tetratricopeptide (TPR) repeat protein
LPVAEAAQLFVDRARSTRPDFAAQPHGDDAVTEICRRLDGLPLAIELAAARVRAMSPAEVAARLGDAQLLAGGPRHAQPRHQSLTAAIDWSYRLLSEPEQQLFAHWSVFAGGADLAAAHAVCARPGSAEADTLDLVTALLDKSLVTAVHSPGGTRYQMLETLRAYGHQQLPDDGALARRHALYYVDLAERAARGVQGRDERAWIDRTRPDFDNLRTAFERAVVDRDADLALRLTASLPEVSQIRIGYEAADWAERALDLAQELHRTEHPQFVAAVGAAARGAWNRGDFARALALAARAGDRAPAAGTARTGHPPDVVADVALYEGDVDTALRHYLAQVEQARTDGDPIRLVWTLYYVAICHAVRREPEVGRPFAQECFDVAEPTTNPTARSMAHYALGLVLKKSDPTRALGLFDRAAVLAASVANFWWQGIALMEAAATRGVHGDERVAAGDFGAVLEHWDRVGDQTQQWLNLRYVVRLLVRLGADQDAIALHHCLLASGKPSPLDAERAAGLADGPEGLRHRAAAAAGSRLTMSEAVRQAQAALSRLS